MRRKLPPPRPPHTRTHRRRACAAARLCKVAAPLCGDVSVRSSSTRRASPVLPETPTVLPDTPPTRRPETRWMTDRSWTTRISSGEYSLVLVET